MSDESGAGAPLNQEAFQLRLQAKTEKIDAHESTIAELQAKIATLQNDAERATTYKEQRDEARAARKADAEKWAVSSAMMTHGITDPDEQDLVNFAYGRLDDDGRKKYETVNGWLAAEDGARQNKLLANIFSDNRSAEDNGKRKQPPKDDGGAGTPGTPETGMDKRKRYYDAMSERNADPTNPQKRAAYSKAASEYLG